MSRLSSSDGIEVALLGEVGSCTVSGEVRGAGLSCGGVEFFSEEGVEGGPPGLSAVGGPFGRGKEGGETGEVTVEPGLEGKPGGERRRLKNGEGFE